MCYVPLWERVDEQTIMERTGHSSIFSVRRYKKTTTKKVWDGFWFDAMQVSSAGIGRWWEGKYFNISPKVACWKEDSIPVAGHKESAPLFLGAIWTWVVVRWISPTTLTKQLLSYFFVQTCCVCLLWLQHSLNNYWVTYACMPWLLILMYSLDLISVLWDNYSKILSLPLDTWVYSIEHLDTWANSLS